MTGRPMKQFIENKNIETIINFGKNIDIIGIDIRDMTNIRG